MEQEPVFLTLAETAEIHAYQIDHFGGTNGLRSLDLLKSAVGMPSSTFGGSYLHPTIPDMAAAYLFHLVENHPFLDGNKRVGTMSALVFLELNGYDSTPRMMNLPALCCRSRTERWRRMSFPRSSGSIPAPDEPAVFPA